MKNLIVMGQKKRQSINRDLPPTLQLNSQSGDLNLSDYNVNVSAVPGLESTHLQLMMSPINSSHKNIFVGNQSPKSLGSGPSNRSGANLLQEMNQIVHQIMLNTGRLNQKSNNNISMSSDPDKIETTQKRTQDDYLADCLIINKQERRKQVQEVINSYNTLTASEIELA